MIVRLILCFSWIALSQTEDVRIQQMQQSIDHLEAAVVTLTNRINELTANSKSSQASGSYETIAFSAYPSISDYAYYDGMKLRFDRTTLNVGGHYSEGDGHFVAPVKGIYYFSLSSQAEVDFEGSVAVYINGVMGFRTRVEPTEVKTGATNAMTFELGAGDLVELRGHGEGQLVCGDGAKQTSFTGFLMDWDRPNP